MGGRVIQGTETFIHVYFFLVQKGLGRGGMSVGMTNQGMKKYVHAYVSMCFIS